MKLDLKYGVLHWIDPFGMPRFQPIEVEALLELRFAELSGQPGRKTERPKAVPSDPR